MKLSKSRRDQLILLTVMLSAAALRFIGLSSTPPGLTHDEAVHGISAWNIVTGVERPIYFAVANGREPLFDYVTALLMAVLGPTWLAPRLVSAMFGLVLIIATYALVKKLFSGRVALLTATMLGLSFWPVMVSRHALRTVTMPVFLVLGVYFWLITARSDHNQPRRVPTWLLSGLMLGLSFYTYIPARIMWLLLPAALLWWLLFQRQKFSAMWQPTLAALGTMGAVASPLLIFLARNPSAESRIRDLAGPLTEAGNGNWSLLLNNISEGIRLIVTVGDSAWRYNIPERPILAPLFAAFFGFGLIAIWFFKKDEELAGDLFEKPAGFIFAWLLLGLIPVFVTGSFLATTQAVAIMPVVYIFPAVFLDRLWGWSSENTRVLGGAMLLFLFAYLGLNTVQTYFVDWGSHPEVRLQYETAVFDAISELDQSFSGSVALSVDEPGRYHDGAVAQLANSNPDVTIKTFDGRQSLLIPAGETFTLIDTQLAPLFMLPAANPDATDEEADGPADIDGVLRQIELNGPDLRRDFTDFLVQSNDVIQFGEMIDLAAFQVRPDPQNEQVAIMTVWQVVEPPAGDLVLFTQIFSRDGTMISQEDLLSAPTASWGKDDTIVQLHRLEVSADLIEADNPIAGSIMDVQQLIIGWYDPATGERLLLDINDEPAGDFLELTQ